MQSIRQVQDGLTRWMEFARSYDGIVEELQEAIRTGTLTVRDSSNEVQIFGGSNRSVNKYEPC